MAFDNICKYLSEKYPNSYAGWLFGQTPASLEVLKTELNVEPIRADFVAKLNQQQRILHIEFQVSGKTDPPLPLRMLDYWIRFYRIYRLPVTQYLILLQESPSAAEVPSQFTLEGTTHHYNVIRLWEQNPEPLLQDHALLPLAVLCAAEDKTQLLTQVATEIDKIEIPEQKEIISNCTQILAGLRFKKEIIRQLFREDIMRESVIYQDIFLEGRAEGRKEEALSVITRQLRRRFGELTPDLEQRLQALSLTQLENLIDALWDFSQFADVLTWLETHQENPD
jgi:predicted transposase YdaD